MPLYEYRCDACQHVFEVIQKFSDAPIAVCPVCGHGHVEKLPSSPAIQFKGTGWYITDYARKGQTGQNGAAGSSASSGKNEGSSGGESAGANASGEAGAGTTESKSDSKAESKTESKTASKAESKTSASSSKKD
jgi:putative FmdB family regulatory protein